MTSSAVSRPSSASSGGLPALSQVLAPASARPERSMGFSIIGPDSRRQAVLRAGELPEVETEAPALAVEVALLVGQEEAVGGQVEDSGRAASRLEPALQGRGVEPGGYAEQGGDPLALGPRPRQPMEMVRAAVAVQVARVAAGEGGGVATVGPAAWASPRLRAAAEQAGPEPDLAVPAGRRSRFRGRNPGRRRPRGSPGWPVTAVPKRSTSRPQLR